MSRCLGLILMPVLLFSLMVGNYPAAGVFPGTPSSAHFGFGAVLYPKGHYVPESLKMASDLGLDWISVPVAWSDYQSGPMASAHLESLDAIMAYAGEHKIGVLLSISQAPAWAQTSHGPDPNLTAQFVAALYQRYPQSLQAVELFPGANTRAGWGSPADADAYYTLFRRVADELHQVQAPVVLVAAGLQPLSASPAVGDLDDLIFLERLYQLGAASVMPVISIQYADLAEDVLRYPDGAEHRILRHYEEVRRIMVENQHKKGLIWITHLSLPSGTIDISDSAIKDEAAQANWMSQVYLQSRAQLYIGVSIVQSLNPGPEGSTAAGVPSLLLGENHYHPFYGTLRDMISLNRAGSVINTPGKPKEGNFAKNRP